MKSWLHNISESYVEGRVPVRRDLREHYVSLTEQQRFNLLSENFLIYLDEQLKNAYGFGVGDLTEEHLNIFLEAIRDMATGGTLGGDNRGQELSAARKAARVKGVSKLVGVVRAGGPNAEKAGRMLGSYGFAGKGEHHQDEDSADRSLNPYVVHTRPDARTGFAKRTRLTDKNRYTGIAVTQQDAGTSDSPNPIGSVHRAGGGLIGGQEKITFQHEDERKRIIQARRDARSKSQDARLAGPEL